MEPGKSRTKVTLTAMPAQEFEVITKDITNFLDHIHGSEDEVLSPRVASVLESVLKDADDVCPCEDFLEGHFLTDLIQEMADLASDTSEDTGESIYGLSKASYYPRMAMTGSSVVVFPDRVITDKVATFISNTSIAYKGTVRDMNMSNSAVTYRINLISINPSSGAPDVHPIDFSNDIEYWAFIEAVSAAIKAEPGDSSFYWSGRGMVHSADSSTASDIVKFLSGASGNTNIIEITSEKIMISAGQLSTFEMALYDLKAMALTCDWHAPSEYVLEIDMQGSDAGFYNFAGFSLALLDRDLEVLRNPQYYHKLIHHYINDEGKETALELTRVLIPLTLENLQSEQTPAGLHSVAVLKANPVKTNKQGAAASKVDDIAALDTIPFSAFKAYAPDRRGSINNTATNYNFKPRLQQSSIHDVTIATDPLDKAVEVHILGAVDLPLQSGGYEPTCYCGVYLVDMQGEKINAKGTGMAAKIFGSSEEGEWKTDTIKNKTNPMWDTKLVLQGEHEVGIDSVQSVVIIVKEVSSRFSRPKHLGQVTIPIGCFLTGTSVPLTLPLEMTTKMTGDSNSITGVLHVMTQHVTVKNGKVADRVSEASVVKPINRARSGSVFSKPKEDTPDKLPIQYTLKAAATDALNVFWPFVVLGGGVGASSGYIALGAQGMHISMSPGAGGILANCVENRSFADRRKSGVAMAGTGNYFSLNWSAIEEVLPLTASVLKVRVIVRKAAASTNTKKGASDQQQQSASISLLVAPCPSKALQHGVHERQMGLATRVEVHSFKEQVQSYRASDLKSSQGAQEVIVSARMLVSKLEDSISKYSLYDGMKSLQPAHVDIEEVAAQFSVANRWKSREERDRSGGGMKKKSLEKNSASAILAAKEVQSIISPAIFDEHDKAVVSTRAKLRAQLYRLVLIDLCKHVGGEQTDERRRRNSFNFKNDKDLDIYVVPSYSIAGVQAVVKHDKEQILAHAAMFSGNLATELFELHSKLIKVARDRVVDYVNCSAEAENELVLRECLRELIEGYFILMRDEFQVYLGSPANFKRTPGQEAKIMLLQMVVFCDEALDSIVRKNMWCVNGQLSPSLSLLDSKFKPKDVVLWYASSLQTETAQWLSKTIKQAATFKNNSNLPWDFNVNGPHVISSLPETVIKQNNSFLELCDRTATKFAFATASIYPKKYQSGDAYESEIDKLRDTISFEMVESSNRCLLLLAEEYQNALQTKNWSKTQHHRRSAYNLAVEKAIDEEANFMFLLSIANDCGRVIDIANSTIEADPMGPNAESARKVAARFKSVADIVIIEIFRTIFADVHDLIIDFRNEWETQTELVVKKLIHNCTSYFEYTGRKLMHKSYHDSIVGYCANVITGCFLLLIKSRAGEDKKFDAAEYARFKYDIDNINKKFSRSLGRSDLDNAIMPVSLLQDIAGVIVTPHAASGKKKLSPTEELTRASSPLAKIMSAVTFEYSRQVSDGVLKDSIYMRPDVGSDVVQVLSQCLRSDSANLRFQKFTLADRFFPSHEEAFHSMCEKIYDKNATSGSKSDVNFFKKVRVGLSNAFTVNEKEQQTRDVNSRLLKILDLEDIDEDERLEAARKRRDAANREENKNSKASDNDNCTLTISRIEVRGLVSSSFFSAPNPYVAINVDSQRVKTSVQWGAKGGAVDFAGTVLTVTHPKATLSTGVMEIEVNDKERLRRKRYIGKVEIKLGGLDLHRIESWFALKGGENDGAEVFVCVDTVHREQPT